MTLDSLGGRSSRRLWALASIVVIAIVATGALVRGTAAPRFARTRASLIAGVDSLDSAVTLLASAATKSDRLRAFQAARTHYKHLEAALEYFSPAIAAALNGPIAEASTDDDAVPGSGPRGLQFAEAALFGGDSTCDWRASRAELGRARSLLHRFRDDLPYVYATDAQVLEIARLELARVATLGIAGFDAGWSNSAIRESAEALDGTLALLGGAESDVSVATDRLASAARYLRAHPDFDEFDRFDFVTRFALPGFTAIAMARRMLGEPRVALNRVWPRDVASAYDASRFDRMAYAPPYAPRPSAELVALGADLFVDPRLSGTGRRACASCHVPSLGFRDGRVRARPLDDDAPRPARRTPSLIDVALQPAQFADERAATLEDQVAQVLASPAEMRSSLVAAAARAQASGAYHGRIGDSAITPRMVQVALAAYVRSLTSLDSRFDRAVREGGDPELLTRDERRGFNLFMGKARCGTCHFAPLFNGTAPPTFVSSEVEVIGVPARVGGSRVDGDSGRAAIDRLDAHVHAFKTPTVRAAALGGPYMHNGALRTLDDVLDFYDRGGAHTANQTLSSRPLHLTATDRDALKAFLRSLDDRPR